MQRASRARASATGVAPTTISERACTKGSIYTSTAPSDVQVIGTTSVTLELSGGLLPDGTDTVTLDEGESITLYNATAKRSYKIKLVDVRPA